ncbi:alpha/beta hydrolase [Lachnoanaerobaculum orale]|uniref:Alpha/beta hydrolase n=2 Tax=Lachnoanaerobaculum orale TaxID=979627 RepID=A0A3P3QAB7_9FIRM|nr:alpha/beta hydrolase [Lachnoanaerobaculum orale]
MMIDLNKEKLNIKDKKITLYKSTDKNAPLIVFNTFEGDGEDVYQALQNMGCTSINLLVVGNIDWNHDMSPWYMPSIYSKEKSFSGGADEYLRLLIDEILLKAKELIEGEPKFTGIAGYSLAGLFAVYAMYKTDVFDRVASMSGSLWFSNFIEYCKRNEYKRLPDKIYFSLGDKEANTRNPVLKTVQDKTIELSEYFKILGSEVIFELNPGNHFTDTILRSAKGIKAIL